MRSYKIAVIAGDGIGIEVMGSALAVLDRLQKRFGFKLEPVEIRAGAGYFAETGMDLEPDGMERMGALDAILLGAIGLPSIRHEDGTEITPHLRIRTTFGLLAGVRPVRSFANTTRILADPRGSELDFVILRESTEGLFASLGVGAVENDETAREVLVITRATSEKLFDHAFAIARRRREKGRGKGRVTCVDKANVFTSMAFFRKIFDERAALNSDITADHAYVDATALDLVRKPWDFDVMVMENMFGDILSDLGGGLVGGMGLAPCAELGTDHALFQPAHGSAPDIAGEDKANPTAMLLSAAMMLDWLGVRHDDSALVEAGEALDGAVERVYADGMVKTFEFGGSTGTSAFTQAVLEVLARP